MEDEAALLPGMHFGSYQIVRPLGRGAFGSVYEALRLPIQKPVALKVLHARHGGNRKLTQRFLLEAHAVARIQHPHIADTSDLGEVDGIPYLAMELLQGDTLEARLRASLQQRHAPLSLTETADLMLPVLSALATVHALGIVHRDIKPENIFIARVRGADCPKLLDFGIAKFHNEQQGSLTETGSVLGSPRYMAPEQFRSTRAVTAVADLWSVGVTLYRLCTGHHPFRRGTYAEIFESVAYDTPTPPSSLRPELPAAFDAVIASCLQRDPTLRMPSAQALGMALLPFASLKAQTLFRAEFESHSPNLSAQPPTLPPSANTQDGSSIGPMLVSTATPPSTRRGWRPFAVAVAVLGLLPLGAVGWRRHRAQPAASAPVATSRAAPAPAAPDVVSIVRVVPDHASLRLDDGPPSIGTLLLHLPQRGQPHRIVASAPGYHTQTLSFTAGQALPATLELRSDAPTAQVLAPAATTEASPVPRAPSHRATSNVRPSARPPRPTPAVEPRRQAIPSV